VAREGLSGLGLARYGRLGKVWRGTVRTGWARRGRLGWAGLSLAWRGKEWQAGPAEAGPH